jgi:hypothetical protein
MSPLPKSTTASLRERTLAMAEIVALADFKRDRNRSRTEARLQAEYDDAGRAYVELVEYCAGITRAAGWKEGEPSADIIGPELLAELRRAANLLLASEAALNGWPGPLPNASA